MGKDSSNRVPTRLPDQARNRIIVIAVSITAIFVVILLITLNTGSEGIVDPEPRSYPMASGTTMGSEDAPVTMIEFSDFQCPFCGEFHEKSLPMIMENYVATGKVRFVYRNFTILGPNSYRAAKAALCANEQDSFWRYHDYLFANQNERDPTAFSNERLEEMAERAGLDLDRFRACLIDDRTHDIIDEDNLIAQNAGASTTPTFLIDGTLIRGARPYGEFEAEIEAALAGEN